MNEAKKKELGIKLKTARQKAGKTQVEISIEAGINVNYYAGIERAEENPTIEIIEKICKALKVKSSDILPF